MTSGYPLRPRARFFSSRPLTCCAVGQRTQKPESDSLDATEPETRSRQDSSLDTTVFHFAARILSRACHLSGAQCHVRRCEASQSNWTKRPSTARSLQAGAAVRAQDIPVARVAAKMAALDFEADECQAATVTVTRRGGTCSSGTSLGAIPLAGGGVRPGGESSVGLRSESNLCPAASAEVHDDSLLWLSCWLSLRPNLAGMDGNRTHPGRLSSAPQTVLKTAEGTSPRTSPALTRRNSGA